MFSANSSSFGVCQLCDGELTTTNVITENETKADQEYTLSAPSVETTPE